MADTKQTLDDATAELMEAVSEAAHQRRVAKQHMGDPDNYGFARARRHADSVAAQKLEACIAACESHLHRIAQKDRNSPEVKS